MYYHASMVARPTKLILTLLCLYVAGTVDAAPLFDEHSILEVRLTGPLSRVTRDTRKRRELPFTLAVDGVETRVDVRVRGKSRARICRFPPLRLDFPAQDTRAPLFQALDRVKMVTHCDWEGDRSTASLLNEYLAYRIFNLIADVSYRVRLLLITYVDTDEKMRRLDRQYYGFLVEPAEVLAERAGAEPLEVPAVPVSATASHHAALLNVFQYLIGNSDWSLVTADGEDACCHNVDVIDTGPGWQLVPFDFDLAGLVDARYDSRFDLQQTRRRVYAGYCRTPRDRMAAALDEVRQLESEILDLARQVPSVDEESLRERIEYLESFFDADVGQLLQGFDRQCVGPR